MKVLDLIPVQEGWAIKNMVVLVISNLDASRPVPDEGATQPLRHLTWTMTHHLPEYWFCLIEAWYIATSPNKIKLEFEEEDEGIKHGINKEKLFPDGSIYYFQGKAPLYCIPSF